MCVAYVHNCLLVAFYCWTNHRIALLGRVCAWVCLFIYWYLLWKRTSWSVSSYVFLRLYCNNNNGMWWDRIKESWQCEQSLNKFCILQHLYQQSHVDRRKTALIEMTETFKESSPGSWLRSLALFYRMYPKYDVVPQLVTNQSSIILFIWTRTRVCDATLPRTIREWIDVSIITNSSNWNWKASTIRSIISSTNNEDRAHWFDDSHKKSVCDHDWIFFVRKIIFFSVRVSLTIWWCLGRKSFILDR